MKTRISLLGRATPVKISHLRKTLPDIVRKHKADTSARIPKTAKKVSPMGWWVGALVHPEAQYLLPTIVQMMRVHKGAGNNQWEPKLIRRWAEFAYKLNFRQNGHKLGRMAFALSVIQTLLNRRQSLVEAWIMDVFASQPPSRQPNATQSFGNAFEEAVALLGGGTSEEESESVELQNATEEIGTNEGVVKQTTYTPSALSGYIPQRRPVNLDSGRWNLLGQSLVDSANATRRSFTKRDCDSGMLDNRKLTEIGSGLNLDRVFMQQKSARSKRISVELLIDVSGSMASPVDGEECITTASSMTKAIVESFNKGGVDCKVYTYNDHTRIAKDYKTRQAKWDELWCGGNTNMGDAITRSIKSLSGRQADRRIMLIISDGDCGCTSSDMAQLARQSKIETYGFFIGIQPADEIKRTFTQTFGDLSPKACVGEVCGAVRRSLVNQNR